MSTRAQEVLRAAMAELEAERRREDERQREIKRTMAEAPKAALPAPNGGPVPVVVANPITRLEVTFQRDSQGRLSGMSIQRIQDTTLPAFQVSP